MMTLTRKWKRSREDQFLLPTQDDPSLDDSFPADPQEQEEYFRSLEMSLAQQSFFWRSAYAALMLVFIAFLIYSIFQQAWSPWELRFHACFMEDVDSWMVISADWVAVLACSMAMFGVVKMSTHHRRWLWYSFFTSIPVSVFWLYYMLRMPRFRWDVLWLPIGPLSGAGNCLYLDYLLNVSSQDVRKIRACMYAYKANQ
ncbi:hypothetical protein SAY86_007038 [Trapa natans]|uniref:Uncharacterized protein n=1 Tax=Trapa natans TaxID=22666 RepID=A0AAN7LDV3_TRANT|nr:hypothetical protein SAY86_007038 [Trapa natans]